MIPDKHILDAEGFRQCKNYSVVIPGREVNCCDR